MTTGGRARQGVVFEEKPVGRGQGAGGWLGDLRLGEARREGRLEIVPVLREGDGTPPGVLLTSQAVAAGLLEIVERGEGVVQELLARNLGELPVAILEGDTLVGCKQNRVVAHSVIVAPGTSLGVPVGCMEQGRWSHETHAFSSGALKMAPEVRRRTVLDVKASAELSGERRLDQARLWSDVEVALCSSGTASPTSNYYDIVERQGREARETARRLAPVEAQVGVMVLANGALVGFEAAGHQELWSVLSEPTLGSYLMGRHRGGEVKREERASAPEWLARVRAARVRTTAGLGLGRDVEVDGMGLVGVGLALGALLVHAAVFPS